MDTNRQDLLAPHQNGAVQANSRQEQVLVQPPKRTAIPGLSSKTHG